MSIDKGVLYVVATPIGNLSDITQRALSTLAGVDRVLAEDTRHSARLLRHYGIGTPVSSLHEHNERRQAPSLIRRLERGESMALISDAGTPLISDPGYHLVRGAHEAGLRVVPIPGACALICALSVAGLPTDRFAFEGFLPTRAGPRRRRLAELAREPRTLVFYEAPHRIETALGDLAEAFGGQRQAALARELTKAFETLWGGTLATLSERLGEAPGRRRGEFVVVVAGAAPPEPGAWSAEDERILRTLLAELPLKQAVGLAARLTGRKRNLVYRRATALRR